MSHLQLIVQQFLFSMNNYQIRNAEIYSILKWVPQADIQWLWLSLQQPPHTYFSRQESKVDWNKAFASFSSVFKSSSTTAAGGCDVNGGEIAGYFPSPRANKCHAYSWIRNVTGTMTRHTMCVQGRYWHSFDLISVKSTATCVFPR